METKNNEFFYIKEMTEEKAKYFFKELLQDYVTVIITPSGKRFIKQF